MKKSWWNSAPSFPSPVGAGRFPCDARKCFGGSRTEREGKKGNEFPPKLLHPGLEVMLLEEFPKPISQLNHHQNSYKLKIPKGFSKNLLSTGI